MLLPSRFKFVRKRRIIIALVLVVQVLGVHLFGAYFKTPSRSLFKRASSPSPPPSFQISKSPLIQLTQKRSSTMPRWFSLIPPPCRQSCGYMQPTVFFGMPVALITTAAGTNSAPPCEGSTAQRHFRQALSEKQKRMMVMMMLMIIIITIMTWYEIKKMIAMNE